MQPIEPPQPLPSHHQAPECLRNVTAEAWEGGGFLGLAYGPLIEALDDWRVPVVHHAGTSAGAITAMLRALGTSGPRVRELQETTEWAKFAAYRPPALLRLLVSGGWHSLSYAKRWIEARVEEAGLPTSVSFSGLRQAKGRHLYVVTTRYALRNGGRDILAETHVFSPLRTPEASVVDAVLASMAVPVFWTPVQVDGFWHSDGGVACNHPLDIFAGLEPETVFAARIDSAREFARDSGLLSSRAVKPKLSEVIASLAGLLRREANKAHLPERLWQRVVRIDVGSESALDFRATPERVAKLRGAGERALNAWLEGMMRKDQAAGAAPTSQ